MGERPFTCEVLIDLQGHVIFENTCASQILNHILIVESHHHFTRSNFTSKLTICLAI